MVDGEEDLPGVGHHDAHDGDLVDVVLEQRAVGIDGACAHHQRVGAKAAQELLGKRTDDARVLRPQPAAGHHHVEVAARVEQARHPQAGGDDAQVVAGVERTGDVFHGRAACQEDRAAVGDARRDRLGDCALGGDVRDLPLLERNVDRRGRLRGPAVVARQESLAGQPADVAADRLLRHAEERSELVDAHVPARADHREQLVVARIAGDARREVGDARHRSAALARSTVVRGSGSPRR